MSYENQQLSGEMNIICSLNAANNEIRKVWMKKKVQTSKKGSSVCLY